MYDVRCTMYEKHAFLVPHTSNIVHQNEVMSRRGNRRKTGMPPGTLVYTGDSQVDNPDVSIIHYNETSISEKLLRGLDCPPSPFENITTWYDVRGLNDVKLIEHIGQVFHIHPLVLEDILNTQQRPKWEDYQNGIFLVVRSLRLEDKAFELIGEQISFFLGTDFIITFQEDTHDIFSNIRERLHRGQGKIRQKKADYLAYTLLDTIIDEYYLILDKTEEAIEQLEEEILRDADKASRNKIYQLKQLFTEIRRAVLPLRDVVGRFSREEGAFVEHSTNLFIRDLHDHLSQVIENLDNQRDMLSNLYELYNSELSNKSNHVMKVLTIVSAIFIPLTFIVGVYGTNFDILPEIHTHYGYFVMWGVMIVIAALQLIYFRKKKWL
jgi:magnesium transporter